MKETIVSIAKIEQAQQSCLNRVVCFEDVLLVDDFQIIYVQTY